MLRHAESCRVILICSIHFSPQKPRQAPQASSRFLAEMMCTCGSRLALVYMQTKAIAAAALAGIQRLFHFHPFELNPHKTTFINVLWEMQLSADCDQNLLRWSWHFLLGERKKTDTGRQVSPGASRGSHPETSHHWVACFQL